MVLPSTTTSTTSTTTTTTKSSETQNIKHTNDFDKIPLPIGGQRVPEGMEAHSNWMSLPEQPPQPIDSSSFGEHFVSLEKKRNALGELKKCVSQLMIQLASMKKNESIVEKDPSKENEIQLLNGKTLSEKETTIQQINSLLENNFKNDYNWSNVISKILIESNRSLNFEEWNKFNEFVKLNTSAMFREQNKLFTRNES